MSATTRTPRPTEAHGDDYLFLDVDEFLRLRDEDGLLEWASVYGDLKGTPRTPIEEARAAGRDVLVRVDVQGAQAVKRHYPDAVVVFLTTPSRDEQRRRLLERGDDPADVDRRLAAADEEEAMAARFDHVVVNDDLSRATEEVAAILTSHRSADSPPA